MTSPFDPSLLLSRRGILGATAGVAAASAVAPSAVGAQTAESPRDVVAPAPRYPFRKSLNLWAMPYPAKMTLEQCLRLAKEAGFEGVELNYDLESDLSPKHGTAHYQEIRRMADRIGIAISGLCTGNIMMYQYPEHWIPILGKRIANVHLKEFTKKGTDTSLESFRPLLDGTTNWPAVMQALSTVGYDGYLTFEYFHPYEHYPEALVFQTSDSMDRMLGRKVYTPA